MAKILDLQAEVRTQSGTGAVKRMRKAGTIPAALYGRKVKPASIQVHGKTFSKLLEGSASDNILVSLKIGAEEQLALVQEVQHDHIKGGILHVDFHAIAMDEEIHAAVPVETIGEAAGAKMGGQLEILLHKLEVRCLPKDLPQKIVIDVSHLNIEDAVHVRELNLPAGVSVKLDGDVVVVILEEPKEVEELPAAAAAAADAKAAAGAKAPAAGAKAAAPAAAAKPAAKK